MPEIIKAKLFFQIIPFFLFFFYHVHILLDEVHLYVGQTAHVWVEVVVDPFTSSWQSHSSDE